MLRAIVCSMLLHVSVDAGLPETMRAAVATGEGSKEGDFSKVKVVTDRAVPQPGRGQVLIKVEASSVNPIDYKILSWPVITAAAFFHPKVLGFDVAGTVVQVGSGCSRLKVGDAIWADLGQSSIWHLPIQLGAWAEYAVADESQVGLKPTKLNFTEAASLPLAALTDLQALRMAGAPWVGRKNLTVVITSGSGGTGTPAIQMAKAWGASRVITASSASHIELLKSLGATDVVDYHKSSIWATLGNDTVDVVYDNFGAPGTADAAMPALRSGGVFVYLPGKDGDVSKHPKAGVKQINYGLCDSSHHEDLDALRVLAEAGELKAVVEQSLPLEQIVEALSTVEAGHVVGKLGIHMTASVNSAVFV